MLNDRFISPLRYPGGKGKIADFFANIFIDNNLEGGTYVEPYVGGGSVALYLLFNGLADNIIINDRDRSLYAFWYAALYYPENLCKLIQDTPIDIPTWKRQKEVQSRKEEAELLELGFSTFFLNRTNRSGILNGGVIGGIQQTGNFLIDARFNKNKLIERIRKIASYVEKIEIHNDDAVKLVSRLCKDLPKKTLFYFDPPYYVKGKGLYMNYYSDQDHIDIAEQIKLIKNQKWIVSYDYVPFIWNLYKGYRRQTFDLNYSAAKAGIGKELMIFSKRLRVLHKEIF